MDAEQLAAQLYDLSVNDWPGEMQFYLEELKRAASVLEIACGTGRIGLRLARQGHEVTGFDLSPHMIEIVRQKGAGINNAKWIVADMTSFDFGRTFDLIIIPGHSLQYMLTVNDQLSCLGSIRKHMAADARVVVHIDHQDVKWLGGLSTEAEGAFGDPSEVRTEDGRPLRIRKRWSYERATQTAAVVTQFEELAQDGAVIASAIRGPIRLHCFFRYEMEHLLHRADLRVMALYGDFARGELKHDSSEMIWVAGGGRR